MPITCENWNQTIDVIARLYYEHIHLNVPKMGNSYQKSDPAILLFLNLIGYLPQMVLSCFMCKMAFNAKIGCDNCYDHYIYNRKEVA